MHFYQGEITNLMAEKSKKLSGLINDSFEKLDTLADVNTIMGKPFITTSGFQIIPFSKVTLGNLSGGGEYGDVKVLKETDNFPFAGGNGAVVSIKPMGFLVDDGTSCRLLRVTDEPLDNLIERTGEILRDMIKK